MVNRSFFVLTISCLAVVLGSCGPTQKVQRTFALSELSMEARRAEQSGDLDRSLELWRQYVDRRPHAHFAEYELGLIETKMGLYSEAIGHLTTAHDLRPGNITYIEALADAYHGAGKVEGMMGLMRATVDEGAAGSGYLRLATYARRVGLLDEAKSAIRSAMIYSGGESAEPYLAMAELANQIGDAELEESALRQALWFDPASNELDQRFLGLGIVPGPSLAIQPGAE